MKTTRNINIQIENLEETISTNEYLTDLCAKGAVEEFYTVTADYQIAGKGQRGNTWESENKKTLLFGVG